MPPVPDMLTSEQLKHVVHLDNRSQRDCVLLVLAVDRKTPKDLASIRSIGRVAGLRRIDDWNIADILAKAPKYAIKVDGGWELASGGVEYVQSLLSGTDLNIVVTDAAHRQRLL